LCNLSIGRLKTLLIPPVIPVSSVPVFKFENSLFQRHESQRQLSKKSKKRPSNQLHELKTNQIGFPKNTMKKIDANDFLFHKTRQLSSVLSSNSSLVLKLSLCLCPYHMFSTNILTWRLFSIHMVSTRQL
jgi:hypothetical protein